MAKRIEVKYDRKVLQKAIYKIGFNVITRYIGIQENYNKLMAEIMVDWFRGILKV